MDRYKQVANGRKRFFIFFFSQIPFCLREFLNSDLKGLPIKQDIRTLHFIIMCYSSVVTVVSVVFDYNNLNFNSKKKRHKNDHRYIINQIL